MIESSLEVFSEIKVAHHSLFFLEVRIFGIDQPSSIQWGWRRDKLSYRDIWEIPEDALICLGDDTSERGLGIVEEIEMLIGCSEILLEDISCVYGKALDGGIGHIFLREYI